MKKLFTADLIRKLDDLTILHEPVSSINLMERASNAFVNVFVNLFSDSYSVVVIAGPGNNGGDGLAIARILNSHKYQVEILLINKGKLSADCAANYHRIKNSTDIIISEITDSDALPELKSENVLLIDALFGSGLTRSPEGIYKDVIEWMNLSGKQIVSVDIPSGMFCEDNGVGNEVVVRASYTISFQLPKIAFFLPEQNHCTGKVIVADIGLLPSAIENADTDYYQVDATFLKSIFRTRPVFSHKGTFGHAFIIAGSVGMAGAALLASKACLRSGAGLVTLYSCASNRIIAQTAIPELIFIADTEADYISTVPSMANYNSVGVGCGIGLKSTGADMLKSLFMQLKTACVIDADAINLLSENKHLLNLIPAFSVLTPHPKEFDRLFGCHKSTWQRIQTARVKAAELKTIIVLKGTHTVVVDTSGRCVFNSTGNSGLATAGTGDVLTGLITGLLAQGYSSLNAAILGVYLHGLAADLALEQQSEESLIASDVINCFGNAFKYLNTIES